MLRRNLHLAALAGLAATLAAPAALAADLGGYNNDYYSDPAPLDMPEDWSGNYVGAQIERLFAATANRA